jgi:hypothetical protein
MDPGDDLIVLGHALPGNVMATSSSGDLKALSPGEAHCIGNVGGVSTSGDERWPLVNEAVVNCPHLVVARIIWSDYHSGKLLTKPVHCLARNCGIHGSLLVRQPDPSGHSVTILPGEGRSE